MILIDSPTALTHLIDHQEIDMGNMIKIVVDIESEKIALDAPMHADLQEKLLNTGSQQNHLWGANIWYDENKKQSNLEYLSLINIRPSLENYSMEIENAEIRLKVTKIIQKLIL